MSSLPDDPTTWTEADHAKIKRNLNRAYWAFMIIGAILAAYMIGWFQGYTA